MAYNVPGECRNGHDREESYRSSADRLVCRTCAQESRERVYARPDYRERKKVYAQRAVKRLRERVYNLLGWECVRCGFDDPRALQLDHIDGGGCIEMAEIGTPGIQRRVLLFPEDYQILCANCNWIKRFENGEVRGN